MNHRKMNLGIPANFKRLLWPDDRRHLLTNLRQRRLSAA
jgi:hypothetical protein